MIAEKNGNTLWRNVAIGTIIGVSFMQLLDKTLSPEIVKELIFEMKPLAYWILDIKVICALTAIYGLDMMHPVFPKKISKSLFWAIISLTILKIIAPV